jgi:peroxiredoxin
MDSVYDALDGKVSDSIIAPMHNDADRIKNKLDTFIYIYTKQHPDSYIALWKLIQKFNTLGYSSIYSQTFNLFSHSIKTTYTAKELSIALKAASATAIGNPFPKIALVNSENKKVRLLTTEKNCKYILLDFWYSHCGPCIAQFDRLKATYNKFKPFGFEIISISTDKSSDQQDWKDAINKYQLVWTHFLDTGGMESGKLSINTFPSNFLLDINGKVIAKDLDPSQLNKFLSEKLSN